MPTILSNAMSTSLQQAIRGGILINFQKEKQKIKEEICTWIKGKYLQGHRKNLFCLEEVLSQVRTQFSQYHNILKINTRQLYNGKCFSLNKETIVPVLTTLMSVERVQLSKINQLLEDQRGTLPLKGGTYSSQALGIVHGRVATLCLRQGGGAVVQPQSSLTMHNELVLEKHYPRNRYSTIF